MTNTIKILTDATADIRAAYVARYIELELAQLCAYRAALAAVGMDAEIFAPYPGGNMHRKDYTRALAKVRRVESWFKSTTPSRSFHGPNIVVERPEAEIRLKTKATLDASAVVDSYLFKLEAKIGKEIVSAMTNGNIWDYAVLRVTCTDNEVQLWRTQCILNRSVLGKIFNQWPTRREK